MSGVSKEPDMELKKAFMELQTRTQAGNQSLRISDIQIENLKRQIAHALLTDQEMKAMPSDTRVYDGVGRMFVLTNIPAVHQKLQLKRDANHQKIAKIQNNKTYLERSLKEAENNLREMIKAKQSAGVAS